MVGWQEAKLEGAAPLEGELERPQLDYQLGDAVVFSSQNSAPD